MSDISLSIVQTIILATPQILGAGCPLERVGQDLLKHVEVIEQVNVRF
jgi:hypothetical protein